MATIKIKFSPSINILRDKNYHFKYIPTQNAIHAFHSILNDTTKGIKSHALIGSYGTGKSSFLLAMQQTLEGIFPHFKIEKSFTTLVPKYEFISVVGEFRSFEGFFAKLYKLGKNYSSSDIIDALDKHYKANKNKGLGLAILVDEFGKFLEYASKHNPESELYFIQLLAEWVNDSDNNTLFVTTLHQDFSAYALHLTKLQRQEWDKVKGRIKDIPFNEPVEQLLFLASERINQKFTNIIVDKYFEKLFEVIKNANAFPLKDYFEKDFAKKLYPFDILSASILTLSLQKYGQNERSLFSFIESNDHLGINEFDYKENRYYSIPRVYDYLINGYYNFLTTKYNPHFTQWGAIRTALERIEGLFNNLEAQKEAEDLIKLIGLLNIFSTGSAKLEPNFYILYSKLALGIQNPEEHLKQLEKKKIIRYINHSFKYVLFEGTDLDIEIAIDDAGRLVEKVSNVVSHLNHYFEFPFISAKAAYYEKGTPRFFQFKLSEDPINLIPEGEIDGYINLVFSEDPKSLNKVEECSRQCKEAILYGYYKNTAEIKNLLFEIQKIKKVKEGNREDKVAIKELESIEDHYVKLLNHYVLDNIYSDNDNIIWFYRGDTKHIKNRQLLNQTLSSICKEVYRDTPVYKNEMVNKTKISGQVASARKKLLEKLFNNIHLPNLGFTNEEFPPEKSIYLTLLRETGIHKVENGVGYLDIIAESSFNDLWNAGVKFLESTRNKERNLVDFINILSTRPFKLKQGFIDFWVPIFLLAKSDEFALYEDGTYIPEVNNDIFDLLNKRPRRFTVKAFDVVGVKLELFNRYRVFLNQAENRKPNNKLFIQTIKPFLVFYRELPEYAKKTTRLDKKTGALRKVIADAKDPEKAFFEDFPTALGFSTAELQENPQVVEKFVKQLQSSIRKLRTCYDELVDRFEKYFIQETLGLESLFPIYRQDLKVRYKGLKTHLLLPHQKVFYSRLISELDDRKAWLNSVAQACIGKPLTNISDEEEKILFDKLKDFVYELDNLCEVSKVQANEDTEDVLKLEITSFIHGMKKNMLRIPKGKNKAIDQEIKKIKANLGSNKNLNITILTKLLQELLTND